MTKDINVNGSVPNGRIFMDDAEALNELSNSKMSLQSVGTNDSSVASERMLGNGYVPLEFEDMLIVLTMGPNDRRFGFSVSGGIDQDHSPRVNKISFASPATRADLQLNDEILEVNGCDVEQMTHAEVIMHIHKCKSTITLKVRRYGDGNMPYVNRDSVEVAIDVPQSIAEQNVAVRNNALLQPGMLKYARTQTKDNINRESNVPAKYYNEAFEDDESDRNSNVPSKFINDGYEGEDVEFYNVTASRSVEVDPNRPKSFALPKFVTLPDDMGKRLNGLNFQNELFHLHHLFSSPNFQAAIKIHNQMTKLEIAKKGMQIFKPVAFNSQFLLTEVRLIIMEMTDPDAVELVNLINKPHIQELLNAHDQIARRENYSDSDVDKSDYEDSLDGEEDEETHYKIVRIDKTNEPLGATVRNEGDAVIISRIIKGGTAEKSGVLKEGDEILEINKESVRGKDVNEVVELLSDLDGTLTFVLLPSIVPHKETPPNDEPVVVKALFDYDATSDEFLPCEELGLSFRKGDVLEVLNQRDPDWWQARLLDNENRQLAGLIPSKVYQIQREAAKITLKGEDTEPILKEKKRCFCGRGKRKAKRKSMRSKRNAPFKEKEVLTYEDMVKFYPDESRKRPIVLIGPPEVGRAELRKRLVSEFPDNYAAPVPHTSRLPTHDELSGLDYIFVSKAMFEKSIANAEFIEQGKVGEHYYGTSVKAVKDVINNGKTCILNLHCSALAVLKNSLLLPYVIFITLPGINRVKQLRELDDSSEPFNPAVRLKESEIDEIIEQAREMNRSYGHLFDKTIVNSDFDQTYDKVLEICSTLEREPQWVPASWLPG